MERVGMALALGLIVVGRLPALPVAADEAAAPAKAPAASQNILRSGQWSMPLPLGLDSESAYIPDDNPMTAAKVSLGKLLYFDPRLSKDNSISCASCHNPFHGFAHPDRTSSGVGLQKGGRNSPTVLNRLFSAEQFWDGRAKDLEEQAHGPLTNPVEMAMPSHDEVVTKVRAVAGYAPLFKQAFGENTVTMGRIAKAIAAYERTVVTGNSPYDRYQAGDKGALSSSAVRGMQLFNGRANCVTCHVGFNFTDENYRNIGVGMKQAKPDVGRYEVTKKDADRGAFKTPTLRNVALTAPYMHDGSEYTLLATIEFYNQGGIPNPNLSADIKPLGLTPQEKIDLVSFMEALTGEVNNASPPDRLPQ